MDAGVDAHVRNTQFGLRTKRGTADAMMIVRRMVDAALEHDGDGSHLVFLDWSKYSIESASIA